MVTCVEPAAAAAAPPLDDMARVAQGRGPATSGRGTAVKAANTRGRAERAAREAATVKDRLSAIASLLVRQRRKNASTTRQLCVAAKARKQGKLRPRSRAAARARRGAARSARSSASSEHELDAL